MVASFRTERPFEESPVGEHDRLTSLALIRHTSRSGQAIDLDRA
ncbi:MAG: hypothetical protein OJF47_002862 [Nitrospira sp.]|nr:MAG: hypothetical protein OJF47_002862 [Nitrospira sp.]